MKLTIRQLRSRAIKALREREKGAKHYEEADRLLDQLVEAGVAGTVINLGKMGAVLVADKYAHTNKVFQPSYARRFELKYVAGKQPESRSA